MAYVSTHAQSFSDRIASALRTTGDFIALLFSANRRIAALRRLNRLSGGDPAAHGTTQQAKLLRIRGPRRTP